MSDVIKSIAILLAAAVAACGGSDNKTDTATDTAADPVVEEAADLAHDPGLDRAEEAAAEPEVEPAPDAPDATADEAAAADPDAVDAAEEEGVDPYCVPRSGSLSFVGLDSGGEGCAAWNAAAGAPEPQKTGHAVTWSTGCLGYSYYYIASRDYVDTGAAAGMHLTGAPSGFPAFQAALTTAGKTFGDVKVRFTVMDLGGDVEGTDWSYDAGTHVETRRYTGGTITFLLGAEPIASGATPDLTALLDYNTLTDCFDDGIGGSTAYVLLADASSSGSASAKAVAAALLADIGGFGVRLVFDSLQPIGAAEFTSNNRTGAYMDAQSGAFQIGTTPISPACD